MKSNENELKKLIEKGLYSEIIKRWNKGIYNGMHDPNQMMLIAAAYYKTGDIINTKKVIEDNFAVISSGVGFHAFYGSVLRKSGLVKEAQQIYEDGLEADNTDPYLKNNYANLLIDINDLDNAEKILTNLLESEPPNIDDVKVNLTRVKHARGIQGERQHDTKPNQYRENHQGDLMDPLQSAFTSEEVAYSLERRAKADRKRLKKEVKDGLSVKDQSSSPLNQAALLEFAQLCRQTYKAEPETTLRDLDFIFKSGLKTPILYDIAADCYLELRDYTSAEMMLVTIFVNGCGNKKAYINLANLARLRGDCDLAEKWLDKAITSDEVNPDIDKAISNLESVLSNNVDVSPFKAKEGSSN